MAKIDTLCNTVEQLLKVDKAAFSGLQERIAGMVLTAECAMAESIEGYSFTFPCNSGDAMALLPLLGINKDMVKQAFRSDWGYLAGSRKGSEPACQILLLIVLYGLRRNDLILVQQALLILLMMV